MADRGSDRFDLTVEEVLGVAPDAFIALDHEWRFSYLNEAAEPLLDRRAADLVGKVVWDEFPGAIDSAFFREYHRAVREQKTVRFTEFYAPLERWFEVQAVPQRSGLSVFFHDVTALKEAEQRAARLAATHASLQVVATAVAAEAGQHVICDLVCRQSCRLMGASAALVVRLEDRCFEVVGGAAAQSSSQPATGRRFDLPAGSPIEQVRGGESVVVADHAAGSLAGLEHRAAVFVPVRRSGEVWGCVLVTWAATNPAAAQAEPTLREFSDLLSVSLDNAEARTELARQAATDPLTGLANLRTLHAELDRRLGHGRPRGGSVALAIVDVDHFKQVNDRFGHEVGDAVLNAVAARLLAACRTEDVAARIGGDEFALILDRCDAVTALEVTERVRRDVEAMTADTGLPPVTVSAGVCAWEPGTSREAMQRRADDALYWAKLHGRNASWSFSAELMATATAPDRAAALRRTGTVVDRAVIEADVRGAKAFWQSALDGLASGIAVLDDSGCIIATNEPWRRFAASNGGDPLTTGVGSDYLAACAGDDADQVAREVAENLRDLLAGTGEDFELDYPCDAPGEERWFTVRANRFGPEHPVRVIVQHQDITPRRLAERESAFQATLLSSIAVPVYAYDAQRRVTYWNGACERFYGRKASEVIGRPVPELGLLDLTETDSAAMRQQLERDGAGDWEVTSVDNVGRRFATAVNVALLRDPSGEPAGAIGTVFDLTERDAYERDLQASRDYLHTVTESIADGLLVFDGSGVVTYANDSACRLLASDDQLVGRSVVDVVYGSAPSDEAAGLLESGADGAERAAVDTFRRADGTEVPVEWTASSLAVAEDDPLRAHTAGSRVVVFRDITERLVQEQRLRREADGLRWAKRLRAALDDERFELHAQPIVALDTEKVVDHELLIRLRDDDGEPLVPPGLFLPAAEEHGLITDIDRWVTDQAIALAATGMPVHFNLSAHSIGDADVLTALSSARERTGIDPGLLTVELTETALLDDRERAAAFAWQLQGVGCHVALDDFGAGYNSFARIMNLPADVLKIDRQFVVDVLHDPASESVVKAILAFAADLGIRVVAEGVENHETGQRLRELGAQFAQGYHFGRPTPLNGRAHRSP